jgi:hypothetical protein
VMDVIPFFKGIRMLGKPTAAGARNTIKAKIGMQLRLMYGEVVDQGVPERFVEMLKRLDDPNCEDK